MFKVGEIVKYAPQYCGAGEEYYIHMVKEADRGHYLIVTLNSPLTIGSSERVTEEMIVKAKKYEIIVIRNADREQKYVITDTEEQKVFGGYDFMGSVDWFDGTEDAYQMDLEEAEMITKDLESADEPDEPEEPKMKLTKDQIIALNSMAQTNWEKAQGMLDGMNAILGTKYGWLAKRVVWFENPDGGTAGKYAACHDALAWAED